MITSEIQNKDQVVFISSFSDFIRALKDFEPMLGTACLNEDDKFFLWYRGHANSRYPLVPSLYRKNSFHLSTSTKDQLTFWEKIKAKEKYYLNSFKIRNYHLIARLPEENLTWMSIMQHYGTPTRLLDWSENALGAFFFALEDYFSTERKNEKALPCVWCLKPYELLRLVNFHFGLNLPSNCLPDMFSFQPNSMTSTIARPSNPNLAKIFIEGDCTQIYQAAECWPLPMIAPYNNDRIRAQGGTFTLFPLAVNKKVNDLESLGIENLPESGKFLRMFILQKPAAISYELKAIGVKRSMFYPEMPSNSYDIEQDLNLHLR